MAYRKSAHRPLLASMKDILSDARLRRPLGQLAAAGLGALTPLAALASPTGGQVVAGTATINTPSPGGTVVRESSQNAVINWQQFSVGQNQYVQFIQPDSSAVVLNRVVGGNISSIFGDIKANGQVFLINPSGILFGRSASLDVGGLVASTLDISNSDFMHGNYVFSKASSPDSGAWVLNRGSITARPGGYVVLAGDYVENDGVINAQSGRVYLAAGGSATLTMDQNSLISYTVDSATLARLAGATNTGRITAAGGAVIMTGDVANTLTATAVNNTGFIAAHSIKNEGGEIVLEAQGGAIYNSGTLDASATQAGVAGGTIILHGTGLTQLTPASMIDTAGYGNATGGFIDLSGHGLAVRGGVTAGKGGKLLLDPASIDIGSGASTGGQSTNPNHVSLNFIASRLNAGSNVEIVASNNVTYTGALGQTLTATSAAAAGKELIIETGAITGCGIGGVCETTGILPGITSLNFGNITLTGLTINIKGNVNIQTANGNVTVDGITANTGIFISGGKVTINGNLAAPSGSLDVSSNPNAPGQGFIHAAGKTLSGQRVNVNLSATSYGGTISIGAINATIKTSVTAGIVVGSSADTIRVGAMNAPDISISATGKHETIVTGALTANNPSGPALVNITEKVLTGGNGTITVNGPITVSGKTAATNGALTQFDLPIAAGLFIDATGSSSAAVRSVKVNGAIDVTAHGGAYHAGSCECGSPKRLQSGTGGLAAAFITVLGSHGAASVTGDITAKGPDALVGVEAHGVQVQNVSVTGSGHHVTRAMGPFVTSGAYASSNSAGQADLILGTHPVTSSYGGPGISATVKAGNITVSGKGVADAGLFASNVSAGNITIGATAASGKITKDSGTVTFSSCAGHCLNANSSDFYDNQSRVPLHLGSIHMGGANIEIDANNNGGGSSGQQAANIKVGTLNATGVGVARVALGGKAITTQGLTATTTKGTLKGSGSSQSGVTAVNVFKHTFDISGGDAEVRIRSGNSGSHGSGVLTQNGGPVTINGNVSATGPTANVDVKGKTIKVAGTVTVTGSGGSVNSTTVFTPAAGTGYQTKFIGSEPTTLNLQGGASGSVAVTGMTTVKAPGIVGVIMVGGNVTLHGFSGSASATKTYTVLDTRVSPTAQNFTAASIGFITADVKAVGGAPAFASASDVGDVTVKSKGNVDLPAMVKIGGNLNVQAVGNIVGSSNGLVGHFNAISSARPRAGNHSGGGPSPGTLPHLTATVNAVSMVAGQGINLSGTQLNIGNGSISSVHGDSTLIAGLAAAGLSPAVPNPNGAFIADGVITLGGIKLTGSYLLLQGTAVGVLGKVSTPAGTLVQVLPFDPTEPIDIEDSLAASSALSHGVVTNVSNPGTTFGLTNSAFLSLFAGDTVAVGGSLEAGDVTIGTSGPLDIGSTNLVIDTSGNVTGLSTVTSTGIVNSLVNLLGPVVPPVTAGEIDPTAGSTGTGLGDQTDKKHLGQPGGLGDQGQQGGTISNDTNGSGVCH